MKKMKQEGQTGEQIDIALIKNDVTYIKENVRAISEKLERDYVTKDQFEPVQKIVYGLASTILIAVVTAVIYLVIRK